MRLLDKPLLTPEALNYLSGLLTPATSVFEWGSGASTIWLAQRVAEVVSVEHNENWHSLVVEALFDRGLEAQVWLLPREKLHRAALDYKPETFDVVLVDGYDAERVNCVRAGRNLVKPGGWLMLDDSQWKRLEKVCQEMWEWGARYNVWGRMDWGPHIGRRKRATFWRKPE